MDYFLVNTYIDNLILLESKYGFQFLNSEQCEELFEKVKTLEQLIIKDNEVLSRIYQWGNETINTYENEIIKNVYNYSTENKYNKALLFMGAAHRKSIIRKIKRYKREGKIKLNWTFYDN